MEVSAHRPLHHTCLRACCTRVVQQDDHVVPGQAVFRFEHGGVPPRVQSVDVSVLVGILSQQEERAMTHSASLLLLSILDQFFFFPPFTFCSSFLKRLQENNVGSPLPSVQGCSSSLGIFSESGWRSSSSAPPFRTPAGCFERCPDSSKPPQSRVCRGYCEGGKKTSWSQ